VGSWARMQTAHGECYGFAAPIFYATYGQPFGSAAKDLHDVILGDNFLYPATPGWDFTTGMGSFDIQAASNALPAVTCAPEAPVSLTAGLLSGTVMLNWTGSPGATSYAIYEGTAAAAEGATPVATTSNTNTLIKGLAGGKSYYFTVKAVNASGSSAVSNEASVAVPLPPAAPTGLVAMPANGQATLSWKAVTGASSYEVFMGTAAGGEKSVPVATGVVHTFANIGGLRDGSTYYFVVKAVNDGGAGAASNEAKATLAANPQAPASVKAVPGTTTGSIVVSWAAVPGTARYDVYAGSTHGGEGSTPKVAGVGGTSTTITGLVSGQTYYFQVTSLGNTGGQSVRSVEASAVAK
jgi:fibronectin type 3 domain-containing protein